MVVVVLTVVAAVADVVRSRAVESCVDDNPRNFLVSGAAPGLQTRGRNTVITMVPLVQPVPVVPLVPTRQDNVHRDGYIANCISHIAYRMHIAILHPPPSWFHDLLSTCREMNFITCKDCFSLLFLNIYCQN